MKTNIVIACLIFMATACSNLREGAETRLATESMETGPRVFTYNKLEVPSPGSNTSKVAIHYGIGFPNAVIHPDQSRSSIFIKLDNCGEDGPEDAARRFIGANALSKIEILSSSDAKAFHFEEPAFYQNLGFKEPLHVPCIDGASIIPDKAKLLKHTSADAETAPTFYLAADTGSKSFLSFSQLCSGLMEGFDVQGRIKRGFYNPRTDKRAPASSEMQTQIALSCINALPYDEDQWKIIWGKEEDIKLVAMQYRDVVLGIRSLDGTVAEDLIDEVGQRKLASFAKGLNIPLVKVTRLNDFTKRLINLDMCDKKLSPSCYPQTSPGETRHRAWNSERDEIEVNDYSYTEAVDISGDQSYVWRALQGPENYLSVMFQKCGNGASFLESIGLGLQSGPFSSNDPESWMKERQSLRDSQGFDKALIVPCITRAAAVCRKQVDQLTLGNRALLFSKDKCQYDSPQNPAFEPSEYEFTLVENVEVLARFPLIFSNNSVLNDKGGAKFGSNLQKVTIKSSGATAFKLTQDRVCEGCAPEKPHPLIHVSGNVTLALENVELDFSGDPVPSVVYEGILADKQARVLLKNSRIGKDLGEQVQDDLPVNSNFAIGLELNQATGFIYGSDVLAEKYAVQAISSRFVIDSPPKDLSRVEIFLPKIHWDSIEGRRGYAAVDVQADSFGVIGKASFVGSTALAFHGNGKLDFSATTFTGDKNAKFGRMVHSFYGLSQAEFAFPVIAGVTYLCQAESQVNKNSRLNFSDADIIPRNNSNIHEPGFKNVGKKICLLDDI